VLGTYTTAPNWGATSAYFYWAPVGGNQSSVRLDTSVNPNKIGRLLAGQIIPHPVSLPKGAYQGWLVVIFRAPPPNQPAIVSSAVVPFTIN
jgi:hypothetical protein